MYRGYRWYHLYTQLTSQEPGSGAEGLFAVIKKTLAAPSEYIGLYHLLTRLTQLCLGQESKPPLEGLFAVRKYKPLPPQISIGGYQNLHVRSKTSVGSAEPIKVS